ncbi:hypothetical protein EVAR_21480_1 [Eumeta japonica]|uniref:Uncharacterized protein n=1 Tax=Eumeta variegata TaxID=151549 RepID=A0A4C1ZNE3_EUMVA|nr:hypothetical protein EVAR_21480_1 [Eumeta japonica]
MSKLSNTLETRRSYVCDVTVSNFKSSPAETCTTTVFLFWIEGLGSLPSTLVRRESEATHGRDHNATNAMMMSVTDGLRVLSEAQSLWFNSIQVKYQLTISPLIRIENCTFWSKAGAFNRRATIAAIYLIPRIESFYLKLRAHERSSVF